MNNLAESFLIMVYYILSTPLCLFIAILYNCNSTILKNVKKRLEDSKYLSCKITNNLKENLKCQ